MARPASPVALNWVRFFGHLCTFIGFFAEKLGSFRNFRVSGQSSSPSFSNRILTLTKYASACHATGCQRRAGWIADSRQSTPRLTPLSRRSLAKADRAFYLARHPVSGNQHLFSRYFTAMSKNNPQIARKAKFETRTPKTGIRFRPM